MSTKQSHAVILLFFLLLSIFLTLGRVGTAFDRFALLTPDLGVYASIAAAQDQPGLFVHDPFLGNEKNLNSYNMVFLPVLRMLENIFGNYGTAAAFLLPFMLFLHLSGYYLLGVTLFKNPWAGLAVSLLLSTPMSTSLDFWGFILDTLPRFIYQSFIPFVLVLSIRYGQNPKMWPWILGAVGLLNYIHPLSTPAWAVAIALGLWVSVSHMPFWQKVGRMFLAGMVLLLILSPFISNYVNSTVVETSQIISYEETMSILRSHISVVGDEYGLSVPAAFFAGRPGHGLDVLWYVIWLLGLGGLVWGLLRRSSHDEKMPLYQLAGWIAGILLVAGLLPVIERVIFAYLKQIPPDFELARTLRYAVPLILLAAVFALQMLAEYFGQKGFLSTTRTVFAFTAAVAFLFLVWGFSNHGKDSELYAVVRQNLKCWVGGHVVCDLSPENMDFIAALDAIREATPTGARIFSEGQEVAIRYYALRPLTFTYKDGAPLAYTDQRQLLVWKQTYDEMDKLLFIRKFPFRHRAFVKEITELARNTDSDYLLLNEPFTESAEYPEELSIVYTNDHYALFKIENP